MVKFLGVEGVPRTLTYLGIELQLSSGTRGCLCFLIVQISFASETCYTGRARGAACGRGARKATGSNRTSGPFHIRPHALYSSVSVWHNTWPLSVCQTPPSVKVEKQWHYQDGNITLTSFQRILVRCDNAYYPWTGVSGPPV